ncbi:MAG TPA: type II toxin-antitoxin system VapB family antitoxin, partial [Candidatus Binatia bacterium]|nr:type II toxin-antitoxin system VapB family antitoxin [Candidatus Binatia bacterium]
WPCGIACLPTAVHPPGRANGVSPIVGTTTRSLQKIRLGYKLLYLIPLEFRVMGMNIKSENTHRRAKELARMAGETIAEAVDRAVTERLERLRRRRNRRAVAEKLLKIGEQCSRLPVLDIRARDEMLYDERGLPR